MLTRLLTGAASLALTAGIASADYSLTILHTNDFHARFEPISKYDGPCGAEDNTAGECFGGSARLMTAIAEARERAGNSILVDGGDQFQGTLFYTQYKGTLAAEMMNQMGYDAMTVGNHEFDDGPEVLRGFMDAVNFLKSLTRFAVLVKTSIAVIKMRGPVNNTHCPGGKMGTAQIWKLNVASNTNPISKTFLARRVKSARQMNIASRRRKITKNNPDNVLIKGATTNRIDTQSPRKNRIAVLIRGERTAIDCNNSDDTIERWAPESAGTPRHLIDPVATKMAAVISPRNTNEPIQNRGWKRKEIKSSF